MGWVCLCITTHRVKGYLTELPGFTLRADFTRVTTVNGFDCKWNTLDILPDKPSQLPTVIHLCPVCA